MPPGHTSRQGSDTAVTGSPGTAPAVGRRVRLRPITPRDYEELYVIATEPAAGLLWRYRGATPGPEAFVRHLWEGVLVQRLVVERDRGRTLGLVGLGSADLVAGHASCFAYLRADALGQGLGVEAVVLLLEEAFQIWPLEKVYFEVPGFGLPQFRSAVGRYVFEEGRLRAHAWAMDRHWDLHVLALTRATWEGPGRRLRSWVHAGTRHGRHVHRG